MGYKGIYMIHIFVINKYIYNNNVTSGQSSMISTLFFFFILVN